MSARLIVIALLVAGSAGGAHAAEGFGVELELCIQTARDADTNCSKLTDDPAQRLQCFQKARGAQLDCLEHALAEAPAGTMTSEDRSGTVLPEPAATGSTDAASHAALSQESSQASGQKASQENAPVSTHGRGTQGGSEANSSDAAGGSAAPKVSSKEPAKEDASTAQATPEAVPSPLPSAMPAAEGPTAAVQSDTPKKDEKSEGKTDGNARLAGLQAKPSESRWVVSETASPVDYSPLLTAVIRPTSGSPGGPVSLAIRCRGGQTGLLIRTERTWHATRRNAIPVDFQINDQSTVRQNWTLSADTKIASYADDAVELLRSLPDGARLTVTVTDGAEQATFLLAGWDAIRKRVETACKWPKTTDQASSGKR